MFDRIFTWLPWVFLPLGVVLWQLTSDSHFLIAFVTMSLFIVVMSWLASTSSEWEQGLEKRRAEALAASVEKGRLEKEERDARMAAYQAVVELADRGIAVRLPETGQNQRV